MVHAESKFVLKYLKFVIYILFVFLIFSTFAYMRLMTICAGWASRTYFSDNGSTAIEIALKMAFRKFSYDHGILLDHLKDNSAKRHPELVVGHINSSLHQHNHCLYQIRQVHLMRDF